MFLNKGIAVNGKTDNVAQWKAFVAPNISKDRGTET